MVVCLRYQVSPKARLAQVYPNSGQSASRAVRSGNYTRFPVFCQDGEGRMIAEVRLTFPTVTAHAIGSADQQIVSMTSYKTRPAPNFSKRGKAMPRPNGRGSIVSI